MPVAGGLAAAGVGADALGTERGRRLLGCPRIWREEDEMVAHLSLRVAHLLRRDPSEVAELARDLAFCLLPAAHLVSIFRN